MSIKLGKKHVQYVDSTGLDRLKQERSHWNPKRRLWDTYCVQILLTQTALRDVHWNPQCGAACSKDTLKPLTPSKQRHYDKLERYYDRSHTGK